MKKNVYVFWGIFLAVIIVFILIWYGIIKMPWRGNTALLIGPAGEKQLSAKESRIIQQQLPDSASSGNTYKTLNIPNSGLKKNLNKINEINKINRLNRRQGG